MALHNVRVLELAGLAPGPYCGLILADFGADVVRVDRTVGGPLGSQDPLARGKRSIALDLKHPDGKAALVQLTEALKAACAARGVEAMADPFDPL